MSLRDEIANRLRDEVYQGDEMVPPLYNWADVVLALLRKRGQRITWSKPAGPNGAGTVWPEFGGVMYFLDLGEEQTQ